MDNHDSWEKLYHAVNRMMMSLGADGEITATSNEAGDVMTALAAIDGGAYDSKLTIRGEGCPGQQKLVQALRVIRTWAAFDAEEQLIPIALLPGEVVALCDKALAEWPGDDE